MEYSKLTTKFEKARELRDSQTKIDYKRIVDEMNDAAFRFCVQQVFPVFDFRVKSIDAVDRAKLKEQLMKLEGFVPIDIRPETEGVKRFYFNVIKVFLQQEIECEKDSRVDRYRNRAFDAMEKSLGGKGSLMDMDDVFIIFVSLYSWKKKYDGSTDLKNPEDISLDVSADMTDWIKAFELPKGSISKKNRLENRFVSKHEYTRAKNFIYVNNILFLARILQQKDILGEGL